MISKPLLINMVARWLCQWLLLKNHQICPNQNKNNHIDDVKSLCKQAFLFLLVSRYEKGARVIAGLLFFSFYLYAPKTIIYHFYYFLK